MWEEEEEKEVGLEIWGKAILKACELMMTNDDI